MIPRSALHLYDELNARYGLGEGLGLSSHVRLDNDVDLPYEYFVVCYSGAPRCHAPIKSEKEALSVFRDLIIEYCEDNREGPIYWSRPPDLDESGDIGVWTALLVRATRR